MHGLAIYVKEELPFAWDLSLETSADSHLCFWLALRYSVSHFFFPYQSPSLSWCMDEVLWINHVIMYLSLETLSIIRTGLPILVELVDLVNSAIIFLSQTALLRWLTFLMASQTVILTVLLFWIYFVLDASICFTMAFPQLGNSDHVVVSVSIDFPSPS